MLMKPIANATAPAAAAVAVAAGGFSGDEQDDAEAYDDDGPERKRSSRPLTLVKPGAHS